MTGERRFRRADRLLRATDFERVMARKCSVRGQVLIIHVCENDTGRPRLGRVVGKRWGNAVTRNRYRRWLREAFRQAIVRLPGVDYVIMPAAKFTYASALQDLEALANKVATKLARGAGA